MKNKTFTFKYDPHLTPERMFADFWKATEGKLHLVKPHEISSPHIEVLLNSINKNRWEIFACLVKKEPKSLTELAQLLNKDYGNIWRDAKILERMGIIELKKKGLEVRPIALYDRIIFDLLVGSKKGLLINQIQVEEKSNVLSNLKKTDLSGITYYNNYSYGRN